MIPVQALARFVLGIALETAEEVAQKTAEKAVEREFRRRQLQEAKKLIAQQVAEAYLEQVKGKSEAYIEAVESMELELGFEDDEGQKLVLIADNVLRKLNVFLEKQSPEGPIIQFLQKRYNEENIRRVTGRLYAGHYVRRRSEGVFSIGNKMRYAPLVDKNKPWLSSEKTSQGIGDIIAEYTEKLFEDAFEGRDLDEDIYREPG